MKNYVLTSGQVTGKGNLTGYTALGVRVHVHKRQLDALGINKAEDIKYPLFVIASEKEYEEQDKDGVATGVKFKRLTALSAFTTKEQLVAAHTDAAMIDVEIAQSISVKATATGLSKEVVENLLAFTV